MLQQIPILEHNCEANAYFKEKVGELAQVDRHGASSHLVAHLVAVKLGQLDLHRVESKKFLAKPKRKVHARLLRQGVIHVLLHCAVQVAHPGRVVQKQTWNALFLTQNLVYIKVPRRHLDTRARLGALVGVLPCFKQPQSVQANVLNALADLATSVRKRLAP